MPQAHQGAFGERDDAAVRFSCKSAGPGALSARRLAGPRGGQKARRAEARVLGIRASAFEKGTETGSVKQGRVSEYYGRDADHQCGHTGLQCGQISLGMREFRPESDVSGLGSDPRRRRFDGQERRHLRQDRTRRSAFPCHS